MTRYLFGLIAVIFLMVLPLADEPEEVPALRDPPYPNSTFDGKSGCVPYMGTQYIWLDNPAGGGKCYVHMLPNKAYCPNKYSWKGQTPNDWDLRTSGSLVCVKNKEGCVAPFEEKEGKCVCPEGSIPGGPNKCKVDCEGNFRKCSTSSNACVYHSDFDGPATDNGEQLCAPGARSNLMIGGSCEVMPELDFTGSKPEFRSRFTGKECKEKPVDNKDKESVYTPKPGESCAAGYGEMKMGTQRRCVKNGNGPKDDTACPAGTMRYQGACKSYKDIFDSKDDDAKSKFCRENPLAPACRNDAPDDQYCKDNPTDPKCKDAGTGPGGGGGKSDDSDFCKQNPTDEKCKNKSEFGGSCGAFSCKGDAVQCAIALEMHKRNCEIFDTNNEFHKAGQKVLEGTDPGIQALPANATTTISMATAFNSGNGSEFIGGGACPAPRHISYTVLGKTHDLSFDWSGICLAAGYVRYLMLICAYLIAARIVFKG